ncbi:hypothetical protein B0H65DRAFT_452472 [Neurospora tetraspora]|uniref:Dienelactone hydrolase domain-containing protein n=1 Tax=Neurospora tetraspora TaxID=94610 RepID=A0AAE0MX63_9PEZI|nr:hypothetical protein B0H65DRAFT_452472 [Neurospora tetraspora]
MSVPVCADCFKGTLRGDVIPTGHEDVIHGLPTYIATPEPWVKPLGTVVLITDAFGWTLRNTRALADSYAKRVPCIVYVPDFMDGKAVPLSLMASFESKPDPNSPWLFRILSRSWNIIKAVPVVLLFLYRTRPSVAWPRVRSFLSAVRSTPSADGTPPKVGVAGFCWGGLYAVGLTNTQNPDNWVTLGGGGKVPLIDCAFTAHPSLLKLPRHIQEVQLPLSLANGEDDAYMGREKMKEVTRILEDKNKTSATEVEVEGADMPNAYEVVVYPGAKHGFAVRGDPEDPLQKERGDQSEVQAVRWFSKWFAMRAFVAKEV